jgi:hypothetical protein
MQQLRNPAVVVAGLEVTDDGKWIIEAGICARFA